MNGFIQQTIYAPSSSPEADKPDGPHGILQPQDPLATRAKTTASNNLPASGSQSLQHGLAMSSRSQSTIGAVNQPQDHINGLDHRPQAAHSHYRHNSKAQGHYQHSRNTSYVNSPATSPLSPQNGGSYSANGVNTPEFSSLTIIHHGTSNRRPAESSASTAIAVSNHSSTSTLVADREQADGSAMMNTQRKADQGNNNRGRRGHSHHRSQSKQQFMQEPTTVGEYALQHLFEAVGNPCLSLHDFRLTRR